MKGEINKAPLDPLLPGPPSTCVPFTYLLLLLTTLFRWRGLIFFTLIHTRDTIVLCFLKISWHPCSP